MNNAPGGFLGDLILTRRLLRPGDKSRNAEGSSTQGSAVSGAPASLTAMAALSLDYLLHAPMRELGFACRSKSVLSACPPHARETDPAADGDVDCLMDIAYARMREITGRADSPETDRGVRGRVLGYLRDDALAAVPAAMWRGASLPGDGAFISPLTTGRILESLSETYARSEDVQARALARRIFLALKSLAVVKSDLAYLPFGHGPCLDEKGGPEIAPTTIGSCAGPVFRYGKLTGDAEAIEFSLLLARGSVEAAMEGSFSGRVHPYTLEACAVAEIAASLAEREMLLWAERVYDFVRGMGGDSGFFPYAAAAPDQVPCADAGGAEGYCAGDTCVTVDMAGIACALARAGKAEYYDHVERYVGNYLRAVQFAPDGRFEEWYRQRHKEMPRDAVEAGIGILRKECPGGFLGHVSPNDLLLERPSFAGLAMPGCCASHATSALYAAWRNTAADASGTVDVNMAFSRDSQYAAVTAFPATDGKIAVAVKKACGLRVRLPFWADTRGVSVLRNGVPAGAEFDGGYVSIEGLGRGETVVILWPVPVFEQSIEAGGSAETRAAYTFHWTGNSITSVEPRGAVFPLYES